MASVTSNINFLSVKFKVNTGPNTGHKNRENGQSAGDGDKARQEKGREDDGASSTNCGKKSFEGVSEHPTKCSK